jgi:hypothetical protein
VYEPALESEVLGTDVPERRELVDALVFERESWPLSEKKRRVDELRFGVVVTGGDSGGEFGPRRLLSRWMALSHSVHGRSCDSPICPHPLCWL